MIGELSKVWTKSMPDPVSSWVSVPGLKVVGDSRPRLGLIEPSTAVVDLVLAR